MTTPFALHRPVLGWRAACLSAASAVALTLAGCGSSGSSGSGSVPSIIEAFIDTQATQVGGATQAVALYNDGTADWTLYSMANRFAATPVGTDSAVIKAAVKEIVAPGYIQHITVIKNYAGKNYALLSMGGKGIGVVDITNATAPAYLRTMTLDYTSPAYTYSDGGGTIFKLASAAHTSGSISDVLVDDKGTINDTTDDQLLIANASFGLQQTKLSNLMDATASGVLPVDGAQTWTLKYSGENPNGGPLRSYP